ncbi:MAG: protein translocase subunit SecF [Elusimicrobia bacterium]|nr:protein translocase subunit SecF [Elusimicrobiota bacterium]
MELFHTPNFNYIKYHKIFFGISLILGIASIGAVLSRGKSFLSIDFTGGTLIQGYFEKEAVPLGDVRASLAEGGLVGAELQSVPEHNAVILRFKTEQSDVDRQGVEDKVKSSFAKSFTENPFVIERAEFVGPVVGRHLLGKASLAIFFSLLGIVIYVAVRFRNWVWGVSGVFALMHDVFLATGFMAITGRELSIAVIAALLTLAGYSINDTIVIFDRIRENIRLRGRVNKEALDVLINRSCNETLSRTIITSLTVFLVLICLLLFGGEVIRDFALSLTFGVVVGSYSTIFIATPMVFLWQIRRNKSLR